MQSSIPAIWSSFLGTGAETMPVPRGAGINLTQMLPHLPVTLQGTVWGLPSLVPQKPRLTGTMESLAMMMAPRMAVATSLLSLLGAGRGSREVFLPLVNPQLGL